MNHTCLPSKLASPAHALASAKVMCVAGEISEFLKSIIPTQLFFASTFHAREGLALSALCRVVNRAPSVSR